jgi:hypothetical protein
VKIAGFFRFLNGKNAGAAVNAWFRICKKGMGKYTKELNVHTTKVGF